MADHTSNCPSGFCEHQHDKLYFLPPQQWPPSDLNRGHIDVCGAATPGESNNILLTQDNLNLEGTEDMMGCKKHDQSSSKGNPVPSDAKQQNSKAKAKGKGRGEARTTNNHNNNNNEDESQPQPDHEIHIWTERERRKKMRNMFSNLHSLLPHLPPKADKSTIVDEAISYIRSLQRTLQLLQSQKLDKEARSAVAASAVTNLEYEPIMAGGAAIFQQQQEQGLEVLNLPEPVALEPWTSQPTLCPTNAIDRCNFNFQTWASPNVVLSVCGEDAHIVVCTPPKQGLLSTVFYILEKHKLDVVTAHISSDNCRSMYMIHAHAHVNGVEYMESTPSCEEAFKSAIGELMFYL